MLRLIILYGLPLASVLAILFVVGGNRWHR